MILVYIVYQAYQWYVLNTVYNQGCQDALKRVIEVFHSMVKQR